MPNQTPPLAKILRGEPDERAVQRMWNGISDELDRPRFRFRPLLVAPAVLAFGAILFVLFGGFEQSKAPREHALTLAGGDPITIIEHPATSTSAHLLSLSDGSAID